MGRTPFGSLSERLLHLKIKKKHRNTLAMGVSMLFMCVEIFLVQFLLRQYLGQVKDKGRSKI